jgi:autotransporter-associated beta strand protein
VAAVRPPIGGQPKPTNTNNIPGLTLNQIRFIGATGSYNIFGNPFTLSNLVSSIEATNTAGINQINNDISIPSGNLVVNVATGAKFILFGVLSGPGGIVKNGGGTNQIAGPNSNTYGGTTTINAGLMELNKLGSPFPATAISGSAIVVGNGASSTTLRNLAQLEIVDTANMTINANATWDLNNWSETVGPNLTISGVIITGAGTASLSPNPNMTIPPSGNATIQGNFNINSGTCTIQDDGALNQYGVLSGSANIVRNGIGSILFDGANTFTGSVTANGGGYIWIASATGFGASSGGVTLNDNTFMYISGGITVANEALTVNSVNVFTMDNFIGDTNTWTGPITLNTNAVFFVAANGSLTLGGTNTGLGGFTKTGPGILTLAGPNNSSFYFGNTTVNQGTLLLNSQNVIRFGTLTVGDGIGGGLSDVVRYLTTPCIVGNASRVVIKSSGLLDLNNFTDDVGPINMDGGRISTGTGTLLLFSPLVTYSTDPTNGAPLFNGNLELLQDTVLGITNDFTINGVISSSGSWTLTKTGPRNLYLSGANTYTGPTIIQQGWLHARTPTALGGTTFGTVVSNNASLVLDNASFGITNEALTLNGAGAAFNWGALDIETFGTNIWAGPITVNADSTFTAFGGGSNLRIIGSISGAGGVTTLPDGLGFIYMEGTNANIYAGTTRVFGGTLLLDKPLFDSTIPHDLIIGDEASADLDTVRLLVVNQIPNGANVTINKNGVLDLNTSYEGLGGIFGTGNLALGTQFLDLYNTNGCTFNGVISGPGYLRQVFGSPGTLVLNGNNTYAGPTLVVGGTVLVNGSQPQSPVTVSTGGTLGGSGTVGDIFCQGHLRPGNNAPGILTCSNLTFAAGGAFNPQVSGRLAGIGYDQVNVRGTNNLASAVLGIDTTLAQGVGVGDQFVVINNDASEPITGTFAGYPEGSSYNPNGFSFVVSYVGGSGNDVVFTVAAVPGGVVSSSISSGNGDHLISPNECNNISVVITNKTAAPMTGISAVLTTLTPGVAITQPYSAYPNVPANGKSTNTAPFQLSTLPDYSCGSDVNLELTVHAASHGSFTVPLVVHSGVPALIPIRFDISSPTNVPDFGTIESTNVVTGVTQSIARVAVSLWMNAPIDSDMNLSLIAPDGTLVDLSSGNGGGPNFGSACSPDVSRTTFDDAAGTSITVGSPPFTGSFRPEGLLSSVLSSPINGNWRLRVNDAFVSGSPDTLRCWSLLLYPLVCAPGGGSCGSCFPIISSAIDASDPTQTNRAYRTLVLSSCASPKSWYPFFGDTGTNFHYETYGFTNTTVDDACVTVELQSASDLMAVAYLNSFDPQNITNYFLGDGGYSTGNGFNGLNGPTSFSVTVPAGQTMIVVVNEITQGAGTQPFTLSITGLPCPPPILSVETVPSSKSHLFWPDSAGGYLLESSPVVQPTTWSTVTNEPVILNGYYNVTNPATAPSQFYRLHKP